MSTSFGRFLLGLPPPLPGESARWRPFVIPIHEIDDRGAGMIIKGRYIGTNVYWRYGYVPDVEFDRRYLYYDPVIETAFVPRAPPTPTPPQDVQAAWAEYITRTVTEHSNIFTGRQREIAAAHRASENAAFARAAGGAGAAPPPNTRVPSPNTRMPLPSAPHAENSLISHTENNHATVPPVYNAGAHGIAPRKNRKYTRRLKHRKTRRN
jgi:hypothetical protein